MGKSWQVGERIDNRWKIHNILLGGMAIVYIVYDQELEEPFAAKTFRDEPFSVTPLVAERFKQEATAWINLDAHPNVTRAVMVQIIEDKLFLFLEYVPGGSLADYIGTPQLTNNLPQILIFGLQFCDGMIHASVKGIKVHRDIKPCNCLLTQEGTLKVTDFGLAKVLDDIGPVKTARGRHESAGASSSIRGAKAGGSRSPNVGLSLTGKTAGTAAYMAPEQFDDAKHVDARADVYSFGVMLYQIAKGGLPFVARTWKGFERLHKTQAPPKLTGKGAKLNALVQTCLAKDPTDRFSNFIEVRDGLAEVYEKLTGQSAPEPAAGEELDAIDWDHKGYNLNKLGYKQEALRCVDRAIELDPDYETAWYNKAIALSQIGRHEEALQSLDRAIKLDPTQHDAWFSRGVILRDLWRLKEAVECYDRALKIDPRDSAALTNKGGALQELGRPRAALACLERALRLNPHDYEAWGIKGTVLKDMGRAKEARTCFDFGLDPKPTECDGWINNGNTLTAKGRHRKAVVCYERALELDPSNSRAWFNKGSVLFHSLRRYGDALACFEKAKSLHHPKAVGAISECRRKLDP
jgi:tetratricopeptide (TPR) repeat protein